MADNIFLAAGVRPMYDVRVPMRDGVTLSVDVFLPKDEPGPFPVVLHRTPYDNADPMRLTMHIDDAIFYAQNGYAYVTQDARGRNDSDGKFYAWVNEFNDGFDTIEWVGSQPWCDGNVGMTGSSYVGNVQWQSAVMGSRYLKTIVPRVIGNNHHEAPHYQGGAFQLALNATWTFMVTGRTWQNIGLYNWDQLFTVLPLKDLMKTAGKDIPHFKDWIDRPDYDDYWKALSTERRYGDVGIPVFQIGGWYDTFSAGTFNNFVGMRERGGSELAKQNQKVLVGP